MADRIAVVPNYRLTKGYGFRLSVAFIAQSRDAGRRATGLPFLSIRAGTQSRRRYPARDRYRHLEHRNPKRWRR